MICLDLDLQVFFGNILSGARLLFMTYLLSSGLKISSASFLFFQVPEALKKQQVLYE
jgi:hypothetical protein